MAALNCSLGSRPRFPLFCPSYSYTHWMVQCFTFVLVTFLLLWWPATMKDLFRLYGSTGVGSITTMPGSTATGKQAGRSGVVLPWELTFWSTNWKQGAVVTGDFGSFGVHPVIHRGHTASSFPNSFTNWGPSIWVPGGHCHSDQHITALFPFF